MAKAHAHSKRRSRNGKTVIASILDIRETTNFDIAEIDYDFEVFDSPQEMRQRIIEKNRHSNKSRILAGYCWDWPKDGRSDTNAHDIKNDDFEISWNLNSDESFAISPTQ